MTDFETSTCPNCRSFVIDEHDCVLGYKPYFVSGMNVLVNSMRVERDREFREAVAGISICIVLGVALVGFIYEIVKGLM